MEIQSLSVVVPNKKCVNNCAFCVSKMHSDNYKNQMDSNLPFYDLYEKDYVKRLEFARDNGCNTIMLTGNSEPQMNRHFLEKFGTMNRSLSKPFRWIEMQTTGVGIDDNYLRFLRNHVGISTISLSINSFDDRINQFYNQAPISLYKDLASLCPSIKKYDFNLRLSLNLCDGFSTNPEIIFNYAKKTLKADQITFRVLYANPTVDTPQNQWIYEHGMKETDINTIRQYIVENGRKLERLPFGAIKYSVDGIGTVLDDDCMSIAQKDSVKYLILRENCKLYTKWDDEGSLMF